MTSEDSPPWGRVKSAPTSRHGRPASRHGRPAPRRGRAVPGRGWHVALATFLALDLLLPLTALLGDDLLEHPWWSVLALSVLRYGLLVPGVVAYSVHGLTCHGSALLCGGEAADDSFERALTGLALTAMAGAVHLGLAVTVMMTALSGGEPVRSSFLAVAGRPIQAHVTAVSPSCLSTADHGCGRADLAGPDGTSLGSVDSAALETARGLAVYESTPSRLPNPPPADFPVAQDPLGLIDPQPIGPEGRVAVQHPLLGAVLAGEWLVTLGLLATLLRPRRRSRNRPAPRRSVAVSAASASTDDQYPEPAAAGPPGSAARQGLSGGRRCARRSRRVPGVDWHDPAR